MTKKATTKKKVAKKKVLKARIVRSRSWRAIAVWETTIAASLIGQYDVETAIRNADKAVEAYKVRFPQ